MNHSISKVTLVNPIAFNCVELEAILRNLMPIIALFGIAKSVLKEALLLLVVPPKLLNVTNF